MLTDPTTVRSTPTSQIRIDTRDLVLLIYFADLLLHTVCQPSGDHILTTIRQLQRCPNFMSLAPELATLLAVHGARLDRYLETHHLPPKSRKP
jgi:hypothetical protein